MQRQQAVISVVVAIAVSLGLLVTGVQAQSGNLEPPDSAVTGGGDPVATTQTQPSWDQILDANDTGDSCNSARFKCVLGGEAVLDKETGLVWERSPDLTPRVWEETGPLANPIDARRYCLILETAGRGGWRLPSIHELHSLRVGDSTLPSGTVLLPPGHPFFDNAEPISNEIFWTTTTIGDDPSRVWLVRFLDGGGGVGTEMKNVAGGLFAWCVRGGGPLTHY